MTPCLTVDVDGLDHGEVDALACSEIYNLGDSDHEPNDHAATEG